MNKQPLRRLLIAVVVLGLLLSARTLAAGNSRVRKTGTKNTVRISETDATDAFLRSDTVALPTAPELGKAITLDVPVFVTARNPLRVKLPVEEPTGNLVVMRILPDGTTVIVRDCALSEDGIIIRVTSDQTVMLAENGKIFRDWIPFWAQNYVSFVTSREIFNGVGKDMFDANGSMNRAMVVKALYELEGTPYEPEHNAFADTEGKWYHKAVNWAYGVGVVRGEKGGFHGTRDVTRQEFATMLCRYAQMKGYSVDNAAPLSDFSDAFSVSEYARSAIQWAVADGLIVGDKGRIKPKDGATRAEVAAVMTRFINYVIART